VKNARCRRLWQVEAIRDGRLTGKLQADAELHLQTCRECQAEAHSLAQLSSSLQREANAGDEVALRRLRQATLARADAILRGSQPSPARRNHSRLVVAFLLLLVVAGAGGWLRLRQAPASAAVQIQASHAALWTRNTSGELESVDLTEGMLTLTVRHGAGTMRFIVRVPDGEIEDVGTKFRVWVSGKKTREIAVVEGGVVFRQKHAAPVMVRAGEVWSPEEAPALPLEVSARTTDAAEPRAMQSEPLERHASTPRHSAKATGSSGTASNAASSVSGAPSSVESGVSEEDLSYLRIVALLREQRSHEAQLAAHEYLRRFPSGFRRVEMARIADTTPTTE
jgi:hypothetical protein